MGQKTALLCRHIASEGIWSIKAFDVGDSTCRRGGGECGFIYILSGWVHQDTATVIEQYQAQLVGTAFSRVDNKRNKEHLPRVLGDLFAGDLRINDLLRDLWGMRAYGFGGEGEGEQLGFFRSGRGCWCLFPLVYLSSRHGKVKHASRSGVARGFPEQPHGFQTAWLQGGAAAGHARERLQLLGLWTSPEIRLRLQ